MIAILRTIVEPNCTFVLRIAISHARDRIRVRDYKSAATKHGGHILTAPSPSSASPWLPPLPETVTPTAAPIMGKGMESHADHGLKSMIGGERRFSGG